MRRIAMCAAAVVIAFALTGCGKKIKEELAACTEEKTQLAELNQSLTTEKQNLETQVGEMTAKVAGLEAEIISLKEQQANRIKARPAGKKKS